MLTFFLFQFSVAAFISLTNTSYYFRRYTHLILYVLMSQELSAQTVYNVLKKVSDEDVHRIGFDPKLARPEWMLVSVLPGDNSQSNFFVPDFTIIIIVILSLSTAATCTPDGNGGG